MENNRPQTSPVMERENIMGTMEINPLLVKLSVPMMISMLVQALYNVVDSIFVARVSENALTAVSLAFSLQNMMFAVGIGTGVGVNALLSKSLGEKNQYRANKTAENGLFLALCSYLVLLVLGLTVVRPYFYAQTADAACTGQGRDVHQNTAFAHESSPSFREKWRNRKRFRKSRKEMRVFHPAFLFKEEDSLSNAKILLISGKKFTVNAQLCPTAAADSPYRPQMPHRRCRPAAPHRAAHPARQSAYLSG